ncbi:MAG: T9SS type A sorting domain-containing protein [Bacteroidetes bacterium]|nr:T9SS type A sorting domain-containing protein [Bacteroidota bacterium]
MKISLSILIFICLPTLVWGGNKIAWQKFVNDTTKRPYSPNWIVQSSTTDSSKNIYFSANSNGGDTSVSIIYKYSPDGLLLWKTAVLPNPSLWRYVTDMDQEGKLYVDIDGNIVFVSIGYDTLGSSVGCRREFILLSKMNPLGTILTTKLHYFPLYYSGQDLLGNICVQPNGDICVPNIIEQPDSDLFVNIFNKNFDSLYEFRQSVNLNGNYFQSFPAMAIKDSFLNLAYSTDGNMVNHLYLLQINMNSGDTVWQQHIVTSDYYLYPLQLEMMDNSLYLCTHHLWKFSLSNGAVLAENSPQDNSRKFVVDTSANRIYCINWNSSEVNLYDEDLNKLNSANTAYWPMNIIKKDSIVSVLGVAVNLSSQLDGRAVEISRYDLGLLKLDSLFYTYPNPIASVTLNLLGPKVNIDINNNLIVLSEVNSEIIQDTLGQSNSASPIFLQKICFNCKEDLKGRVYVDDIQNCEFDFAENIIENNLVHLMPEDIYTSTDSNGFYYFFKSSGNATIDYIPALANSVNCNGINSYSVNMANGYNDTLDFGIRFKNGLYKDISSNIVAGLARPGFQQFAGLKITNHSNQKLYNSKASLTIDNNFSFTSSVPMPDSISGNMLFWNLDSINILGTKYIDIQLFVGAQMGNTFLHSCKAFIMNDIDTSNNSDWVSGTVIGSFDPNYKSASPIGITNHHYIENKTSIDYYIEFQNTGTDTAFNIKITDQIDRNLDLSTFKMIGSSHKYRYSIENNMLNFYFDNVLLVDSNKDYYKSIGYVSYSITPKLCNVGTVINNTAQIYFDFNEPVITNTVYHTIGRPGSYFDPLDKTDFNLFPNPSENNTTNIVVNLAEDSDYTISISNYLGREIQRVNKTHITNGKYYHTIKIENDLCAGLYFVTLRTPNTKVVKKWNIIK